MCVYVCIISKFCLSICIVQVHGMEVGQEIWWDAITKLLTIFCSLLNALEIFFLANLYLSR